MLRITCLIGLLLGLSGAGCNHPATPSTNRVEPTRPANFLADEEHDSDDIDVDVAISDLPQSVRDAATAAVPGLVLTRAELETENGVQLYSIAGVANGEHYEVEVSTTGQLLEVEHEADGDDEDDDHDDDDHED